MFSELRERQRERETLSVGAKLKNLAGLNSDDTVEKNNPVFLSEEKTVLEKTSAGRMPLSDPVWCGGHWTPEAIGTQGMNCYPPVLSTTPRESSPFSIPMISPQYKEND